MAVAQETFDAFVRDFATALRRFTRLRAGAAQEAPSAASLAFLPGVGWLVGATACLVFALVSLALRGNPWASAVAAVFGTLATVLLTGALHEGALFRTFERLEAAAPGARPASALPVIAPLLLIAGKLALLAALAAASEGAVMSTLFAAHVVSRYLPVVVAYALATESARGRELAASALWCLVPLALMVPAAGPFSLVFALLGAAVALGIMLRFLRTRGAAFDDTAAGAVQQVGEIGFYLGAALAAG